MFGGLGLPEIIVIGAAALLVFGPRRLPELAKGLGKGIRDFKKALEGQADPEEPERRPLPPASADPSTPHSASREKSDSPDPIHPS